MLTPLLLRASLFKERSSMLDTVSKATPTPLRSRARVHPEMSCLRVRLPEKVSVCLCEPAAEMCELIDDCTFIDLVSSSTIDDTYSVLAQSDALTWLLFSVAPLS